MSECIIQVADLTRVFVRSSNVGLRFWQRPETTSFAAVEHLNFSIHKGEKVAFIGPNGAGKSTTMKMLSGLLYPTSGSASVCGRTPWDDVRGLSRQIGLVFGQKTHLWPGLSVSDSFDLLAAIYDLEDSAYRLQKEKLVETFGLSSFLHQTARTLSLGQKMRADIAAALLHRPSVLFLDEPTIGLDVTAKALLRDHLNRLVAETELTLLLTSHDTDDVEKICERVILIDHGQKLLDTTLAELHQRFAQTKILRLVTEEAMPTYAHSHVSVEVSEDYHLVLSVDTGSVSLPAIVSDCLTKFSVRDMGIESRPLEDIIKEIYARQKVAL